MKKTVLKNKKGITLIALIITIIIMLILVAVTIAITVNGGLFGYAGNATKDTELAKQNEIKIAEGQIEVDGEKYNSLDNYVNGVESGGEEFSEIYNSTQEYQEDGVTTAWIPKGFAVGTSDGINSASDGLVIQDESGNEFVWIPVDYTATGSVNSNGLDSGFLSVFKRTSWNNNARTAGIGTSYKENASNDPTGKYIEMMQSVQEHKGFYIGRYEAGKSNSNELVIKRDQKPYTNIKWGNTMSNIGTEGIVVSCQGLYTDDDHAVTSTLCYGIEWDAMLDFIKDDNHNVSSSANWGNFNDTNAETWKITRRTAQYYKDSQWHNVEADVEKSVVGKVQLTTGANDNFQAKNIFDAAGNVWEVTMEAYSSAGRIIRGGGYNINGAEWPASSRDLIEPADSDILFGFRVALYL